MFNFLNIDQYLNNGGLMDGKMLFVTGPREVGKTSYILNQIKNLGGSYFNWDDLAVRKAYKNDRNFFTKESQLQEFIVFDEMQKRNKWKNILTNIYDAYKSDYKFIVPGNARFDYLRRRGDGLSGTYHDCHMFPASVATVLNKPLKEYHLGIDLIRDVQDSSNHVDQDTLDLLFNFGGFPEPLIRGTKAFQKRWQERHVQLIVRDELSSLSNLKNLDTIETLVDLLEHRVSSPVSFNSLAGNLSSNHTSVKQWLKQLEKVMLSFHISTWSEGINRALKKNPKVYFYDWSFVRNKGARFENFVATNLLKAITLWNEKSQNIYELFYIRTYDGQEVDFCISKNKIPWLLIEVKHGKPNTSSAIRKFQYKFDIPAVVLTREENWNREKENVFLLSANRFFSYMP